MSERLLEMYEALTPASTHPRERLKRMAKSVRRAEEITHGEALERIARKMGFQNWKSLHNALPEKDA